MPIFVNNQPVEEQAVREEAKRLRDQYRAERPDLDELAFGIELLQFAREKVITHMLLKQAAGNSTTEDFVARLVETVARPRKQEVKAVYQNHPRIFYAPDLIHAAHIVKNVDEGATAEQAEIAIRHVEAKLKAGADFAEIANTDSDCPGEGGDLGFFARGDMVEEFEEAVFDLNAGETSAVFRSPFGFHIAKVLEKRPAGLRPFNEVREQIEEALWRKKKERIIEELMKQLRAIADIRRT